MMRLRSVVIAAAGFSAAFFAPLGKGVQAQIPVGVEPLLARGGIGAVENSLYAAARARPRDPAPRLDLGGYLASRGALRVGAVLFEEARQFGADPAMVAQRLAPLYFQLGDYRALATLPASPLSAAERERAAWLVSNAPSIQAPESVVVTFTRMRDPARIGRVGIRVGADTVQAVLDLGRTGITVVPNLSGVREFGGAADGARAAVAREIRIGGMVLGNVPVTVGDVEDGARAVIGVDVLQRYAATVDARIGRLVLRPAGVLPRAERGDRLITLTDASGVHVAFQGRLIPLAGIEMFDTLQQRRWTLDGRRGMLVLTP